MVGAGHVSYPFFFEKLYPRAQYDWLHHVKEEHTKNYLELRNVFILFFFFQ